MDGSWTIQVIKRDSTVEPFSLAKLRLSLFKAMGGQEEQFASAGHLAHAVRTYLRSNRRRAVTSRAIFEMALRVLHQTSHHAAADALETHSQSRLLARHCCEVLYDDGRKVRWSRRWVTEQFTRRWQIAPGAARALSSEIERRLLDSPQPISRQKVLDEVDELVDQVGLTPWCHLAGAARN